MRLSERHPSEQDATGTGGGPFAPAHWPTAAECKQAEQRLAAQQTFGDSLTLTAEALMEGLTALSHFRQYGPGYSRSVNSKCSDAVLFLGRGNLEAATHYYQLARCAAEEITWEEFIELDPFRAAR